MYNHKPIFSYKKIALRTIIQFYVAYSIYYKKLKKSSDFYLLFFVILTKAKYRGVPSRYTHVLWVSKIPPK